MTGEVRIEASPVGPVVHPPHPAGLVVVYLHGDRYLASAPGVEPGSWVAHHGTLASNWAR